MEVMEEGRIHRPHLSRASPIATSAVDARMEWVVRDVLWRRRVCPPEISSVRKGKFVGADDAETCWGWVAMVEGEDLVALWGGLVAAESGAESGAEAVELTGASISGAFNASTSLGVKA